ncbi:MULTISPECIES: c-type cytochrome [Paracoccus]|uniref:c-type cytochrome n=1 Tax=Paracoccus onubensis TaxID=1675788 RepID=UPI0016002C13|nr:cytochrome c [Paracoccus onubensis]MDP0928960.1 cytochrome c [Paracoccus onubensis]
MPAKLFGRSAVLTITSAIAMTFSSSIPVFAAGFTSEQASTGQTDYQSNCASCHGVRLEGPEAPALFGQDIMGNWDTAGGLYDFISVAMPPAQPGQLGEETYLNIVAYIMQQNGAKPGDTAMDTENMASIGLVAETKEGAAELALANQETAGEEEGDTNVPQAYTWGKELPKFKK